MLFWSVWEAKPNCIGEPLKPEQFSKEGDVGFIRDVCVDIVARNLYNSLKFPVSKACQELANMQTATGSFKCMKWKRSDKRNAKATKEVTAKADALMKELLDVVTKNIRANTYLEAGEFLYDQFNDAERRLKNAGAVAEDSQILDVMDDLKPFLCKHRVVKDSKDLMDLISQFIRNNAAEGVKVSNPSVENTVVDQETITGIFRLKFDFEDGTVKRTGQAIIKIPSLAPMYYTKWRRSFMYVREAKFYESILPAMYSMGQCEPFAPEVYAVTQAYALVLEDLSVTGYRNSPRIESLDLSQSALFLNVLAQFHALGYVYFYESDADNSIKQLIGPHMVTIRRPISKEEFDYICEMVKPLLKETLFQKMLTAKDKILAQFPMQITNDGKSMNVIMHGDLHRKNFLFAYDSEGKASGVKLIDWQIGTVGSPALDLMEFFVHNLHEEIFEANEDKFLDFYIAVINHTLSFVQSNRRYTRVELDQDIAFFKYYYFRVLFDIADYWGALHGPENYELTAKNIAKWIMYFEKKGYI